MSNKVEIETFRKLGSYEAGRLTVDTPTCYNGMVRVKKYRITIEEIDEPIKVVQGRLQKLFDEHTNHHHHEPLQREAARLGMGRLEKR